MIRTLFASVFLFSATAWAEDYPRPVAGQEWENLQTEWEILGEAIEMSERCGIPSDELKALREPVALLPYMLTFEQARKLLRMQFQKPASDDCSAAPWWSDRALGYFRVKAKERAVSGPPLPKAP